VYNRGPGVSTSVTNPMNPRGALTGRTRRSRMLEDSPTIRHAPASRVPAPVDTTTYDRSTARGAAAESPGRARDDPLNLIRIIPAQGSEVPVRAISGAASPLRAALFDSARQGVQIQEANMPARNGSNGHHGHGVNRNGNGAHADVSAPLPKSQ